MQWSAILLVVLFSAIAVNAATVNFKYAYDVEQTFSWDDASSWDTGAVPTANDDVSIIGGEYNTRPINTLNIPSSVTVKSLYYEANDIKITIGGQVTTGGFTVQSYGFITGGSLVITGASSISLSTSTTSFFNNMRLNVTQTGSVTFTGTLGAVTTSVFNFGTWTLKGDSLLGRTGVSLKSFKFYNYGTLRSSITTTSYNENTLTGTVYNYGLVTVDVDSEFQFGESSDDALANSFTSYTGSALTVNGLLKVDDSSAIVLNTGSALNGTGSGEIYLLGYGSWSTLTINIATVNFNGKITMEGSGQITGTSVISVTSIKWLKGARITGTGAITVQDAEFGNNFYGSGGSTVLNGRNFTVTNTFSQSVPDLGFANKAFLILTSTCTSIITSGEFNYFTGDTSAIGFINYGTLSAQPSITAYWLCNIPFYNYGSVNSPNAGENADPSYYTGPAGMSFLDGGIHGGDFIMNDYPDRTDYYGWDSYWSTMELAGHNIMTASATHHGGFRLFLNGDCSEFTSISCYLPGLTQWQARSSTVGNGVIVSHQGSTFQIDGPGVVFERYAIIGGQITGNYNLTVQMMRRTDAGYNAPFQVNGTNVVVINQFDLETGNKMNFVKHGKLVIAPNASIIMYGDLSGTVANSDEGIYNYGTAIIKVDQDTTYYFMGSAFKNFGNIVLDTAIDREDTNKGAILNVYTGGSFTPGASGTINLKVYSKDDSDKVEFFSGSACTYAGALAFDFQYTPQAGDTILVGSVQTDTCSGTFTVKTTNLPSSLQAVLMYDFKSSDGSSSYDNFLAICSTTNATCSNYKRPASAVTGSASSASTSSNNDNSSDDGSSASIISASFILTILSLFAMF